MENSNDISNSKNLIDPSIEATPQQHQTVRQVTEQSRQSVTEELSLKNITQIIFQNWALFVVVFISLFSILMLLYCFKIPYQSTGSVIINDNKNSSLQSFTSQFVGSASVAKGNEAKKANSSVQKSIEYLKTTDFYLKLIKTITENKKINDMTVDEKTGFDQFKTTILNNKKISELSYDEQMLAVKKVDSMFKLNLQSDYEIEVVVSSLDRNIAYFVSKNGLPVITAELKLIEENDLKKIKEFLTSQKNSLDLSIHNLNKQLSDFQSKPENLISLGTNKVGDYISELMVRKNEIKMKISENSKIIMSLGGGNSSRRDSALYGNSGKIQSLKIENEMLQAKLTDLQQTVDRVMVQAKNIPAASITYDELKKKSDLEFQNYKVITENLAKIDANQLSLNSKFEILETPRYDKVKPFLGIAILLLLCIILTQVIGSIIIYLKTIWDTTYVTAQQTRNIVVIDSHSLDPRVIIENSKIKFSLKNTAFDTGDSPATKRIGFDFGSGFSADVKKQTKTVNGDDQ